MLSPARSGHASRSPVMNWELIFPGSINSPCFNVPLIDSGRPPSVWQDTPCAGSTSRYTPMGRSGRRPCPVKVASMPRAAQMGIKKRRVDPLSPQSISVGLCGALPPVTRQVRCSSKMLAPSACAACAVTWMSLETAIGERMLSLARVRRREWRDAPRFWSRARKPSLAGWRGGQSLYSLQPSASAARSLRATL